MKIAKITRTFVCGGVLLALTAAATADIAISHNDLPVGNNAAQLTFLSGEHTVDVSTVGGNFASKTVQGVTGMGISGGSVHGEIDGSQQMTFTFEQPVIITSLEIAHLYTAGNHGDVWNEVALFSTDIGDFSVEAASPTVGDWTGFGTLTNTSPGEEGFGGAWLVSGDDIFGGAITTLSLLSGNPGNHSKYGDFSFVGLHAAQLPAPGALAAMLGAGLIGRTRRRIA